jgi:hypothetical protein
MSPYATSTVQLAELIATKLQVLKVLVRLSRRQVELIEIGEMATLIKLLAAKQTVMNQLQAIERELEPFRGEDPDRRAWRLPAERTACQAQAELANALLASALELEQQAEIAMLHRREHTASTLVALQTASDARTAYAAIPSTPTTSIHAEG